MKSHINQLISKCVNWTCRISWSCSYMQISNNSECFGLLAQYQILLCHIVSTYWGVFVTVMHWGGGAHASVPIYSIIVLLQQSITGLIITWDLWAVKRLVNIQFDRTFKKDDRTFKKDDRTFKKDDRTLELCVGCHYIVAAITLSRLEHEQVHLCNLFNTLQVCSSYKSHTC